MYFFKNIVYLTLGLTFLLADIWTACYLGSVWSQWTYFPLTVSAIGIGLLGILITCVAISNNVDQEKDQNRTPPDRRQ